MKCKEVNKNLLSFLDGELNKQQSEATDQHLAQCEACNRSYLRLKSIYSCIDDEIESYEPNPFLAQKIWDRIHTKESTIYAPVIPMRRTTIVTIAAAGIAFGIAIGSLLSSSVSTAPEGNTEQYWSQLADDYFPSEVYSPYEELNNNE